MKQIKKAAYRGVLRLIRVQMSFAVLLALALYIMVGLAAALSALSGVAIISVSTAFFGYRVLRKQGALAAKAIVNDFYAAQCMKLILAAMLFFLVIRFVPIQPLAFFSAIVLAQLSYWFAPLMFQDGR